MSDLIRITTESEEAVSAATLETILQVRGLTTIRLELAEVHMTTDYATDATKFGLSYVAYQSTDGTATGCTEVAADPNDPTPIMTGFRHFTAEPTPGNFVCHGNFNLNGGEFARYWAEGDGPKIDKATSSRLAVVITADAACNVTAEMAFRIIAA